MASAKLYLTNGIETKKAPIGFSWTVFFFSFFVPLIRGDWKWGAIQALVAIVTSGFSGFVFMFIYNKLYAKDLLNSGYKVEKVEGATLEQVRNRLGLVNIPTVESFKE